MILIDTVRYQIFTTTNSSQQNITFVPQMMSNVSYMMPNMSYMPQMMPSIRF